MSEPAPYALGAQEGEALWFFGTLMLVKASAKQTGERFSLVEQQGRRGMATPLHRHAEDDESFYVLEGELTLYLEDLQPRSVSPGAFAHVPAGAVHAVQVDSETARWLDLTTPQHERFFRAVSEPAQSLNIPPEAPPDMDKVQAAASEFGVEILGPPPGAGG
jgi:quercetin dioxygenase-like cupin family protein